MKCKETISFMYPLLRREITGELRILMFDHLQNCPECRERYKQIVDFTWKTELQKIKPTVFGREQDRELIQLPERPDALKRISNKKWIYLVAAALIAGLIFLPKGFYNGRETHRPVQEQPIERLYSFLGSVGLNEKISISYIRRNLEQLKMQGIEKINLDLILSALENKSFKITKLQRVKYPDINLLSPYSIAVDEALALIDHLNRYKKEISIFELLNIYHNYTGAHKDA